MKIAIVCPGPSVVDSWLGHSGIEGGYELVFPVSKAVNLVQRADLWAVGDLHINMVCAIPNRRLPAGQVVFTNTEGMQNAGYWDWRLIPLEPWLPMPGEPRQFTTPALLNFAISMYPNANIDVFGCDMRGDKYFDGRNIHVVQAVADERWPLERRQMRAVPGIESVRFITDKHSYTRACVLCR